MKNSKLRALLFSDVHLYHAKTKTEHIARGLHRALADNERLRDIDIIFISGDLFDRSVHMPNTDTHYVINFVCHLLEMCHKYDIVLRVLEGTPSHDWKQARLIIDINANRLHPVDVRHVTVLSIEHIERFGIDVLYVPDEWGEGCAATFKEVEDLLIKHNLEKVDLSIMHGCFNYQFPVNLVGKPDVHDEASYLGITKYLILIGHYHTPSSFERIYVPGSFDRLKHGEEEAKGHLDFTIFSDGAYEVNFIENKDAMIYKTLDVSGLELSDSLAHIDTYMSGIGRDTCHIRLLVNKEDPIYSGAKDLNRKYPHASFTISAKDKPKDKMVSESKEIIRPNTLSSDNIVDLMMDRLKAKHPEAAEDCIEMLRSVVNNE